METPPVRKNNQFPASRSERQTNGPPRRKRSGDPFRGWVYTVFNKLDPLDFEPYIKDKTVKYAVYQLEKAPQTDRLHFQLWIEYWKPVRPKKILKLFPHLSHSDLHWEPRYGSPQEARDYHIKEDTRVEGPWEFGSLPKGKGSRSDLHDACDVAKQFGVDQVIADMPHIFVKYHRGLERMEERLQKLRTDWRSYFKKRVIIIYGPTGTGKSRMARSIVRERDIWVAPTGFSNNCFWFDGYKSQDIALFEEFDEGPISYKRMLTLLDGYPTLVPFKGGFATWKPKIIVITANLHFNKWWPSTTDFSAFIRRVSLVTQFPSESFERELTPIIEELERDEKFIEEGIVTIQIPPPAPILVQSIPDFE